MNDSKIKPWSVLSWPNRISMMRLLLVAPFVILLMNQREWGESARYGALAIFVVMAISDAVDGMLARRLNQITRLGAILDPLADKVLIICSVVLLSLDPSAVDGARINNWIVVAVVGKDLWVIIGFIVLYLVTDRFVVHPNRIGKLATFAQLVMVGLVLIAPDLNRLGGRIGWYLAQIAGVTVVAMSIAAVISYTRFGLRAVGEGQEPLENGRGKEK